MRLLNHGEGNLELIDEPAQLEEPENLASDSGSEEKCLECPEKRRKIEQLARDYLNNQPLFIQSASLRGPFGSGWDNPWLPAGKANPKEGTCESKSPLPQQEDRPSWPELARRYMADLRASKAQNNDCVDKVRPRNDVERRVSRETQQRSAGDDTTSLGETETSKAAIGDLVRNGSKTTIVLEEAAKTCNGKEVSGGSLLVNKLSPTSSKRSVLSTEHEQKHSVTTAGFTPINAFKVASSTANIDLEPCTSRRLDFSTINEQPHDLLAGETEHQPDKENKAVSLNADRPGEGRLPTPDMLDLDVPTNTMSARSSKGALSRSTRLETATRVATAIPRRRRPRPRKDRLNIQATYAPNQVSLGQNAKASSPSTPLQRRDEVKADQCSDRPMVNKSTAGPRGQGRVSGLVPAEHKFVGEDWARVQQFTDNLPLAPEPNTSLGKSVSDRAEKSLQGPRASMSSINGPSQGGTREDGKKSSDEYITKSTNSANAQKSELALARPSNTADGGSPSANRRAQTVASAAQELLENFPSPPTEPPDSSKSTVLANPAVTLPKATLADSQRGIALSGAPVSTQNIIASASHSTLSNMQTLVDRETLPSIQAQSHPQAMPQLRSEKGKISNGSNSSNTSAATSGFDESVNVNQEVEDAIKFLSDSFECDTGTEVA
ncbi:MAG: hypothetical protein M1822_003860 [Bathelium mastoideum]|nr:MAG: hypothetical protein M1822_003860 [Bathelium mastoideum]